MSNLIVKHCMRVATLTHKKMYFPNLNGLRFIAASMVIIHHTEQLKSILNFNTYWNKLLFVHELGTLGVNLFFVLSGFLITYLLLEEEFSYNTIHVVKFYIRRILRIWPLYFLIVILAFFILPNIELFLLPGFGKEVIYTNLYLRLFLYAIILPNVVQPLLGIVPYVSHTWSIGTEEQFYFVWPIVLKYFRKHRVFLMLLIVILYFLGSVFLHSNYAHFIPYKSVLIGFWMSFNINCMAIGGLFAILLFQKSKLLKYLQSNLVFYIAIAMVLLIMFNGISFTYFQQDMNAILFGIIILNFATNQSSGISLEYNVLNYLGSISYGLYMYHPIAIVLTLAICKSLHLTSNWYIYPFSFLFTILIAGLSFRYFETYFLKFKSKFNH